MNLRLGALLAIVGLTAAYGNAPLPGSSTYLGIVKPIAVNSWNGTSPGGGGGAFNGTVGAGASQVATTFWCVDDQLYFQLGMSGNANIIRLDQIVADDSRVRYGNVHNGSTFNSTTANTWTNIQSPNNEALPDTAQERYQMAAYLISQYTAISGNLQNGLANQNSLPVNQRTNWEIQRTIWALTSNNTTTSQNTPGQTTFIGDWINKARANYKSIDLTKWAVVSWTVNPNGVLGTLGYRNSAGARQTFLVQVVPEPGFYGLLALGLAGLGVIAQRRRRPEQV